MSTPQVTVSDEGKIGLSLFTDGQETVFNPFTGKINFRKKSRFSPAAADYFARLDAVDLRVTTYDAANARLIDRLVEAGGNLWPDSGAFCAMAGYLFPTLGTLIPLHPNHDAGTLFNFVTGDWNAVTGLKGDGVGKYANSNRNNNADGQDDQSIWTWVSTASTADSAYIGGGSGVGPSAIICDVGNNRILPRVRSSASTKLADADASGFIGASRAIGTEILARSAGANQVIAQVSTAPGASAISVFSRDSVNLFADSRQAIYGVGPNLNGAGELALLDTILTDWQTDLANA